ncbi:hypothetical protein CWI75_13555 [Kineobactrum sediminis]|uniref:HTH cro/C1-type domain-containing protein n=1 Tax=Kineobactrum sediminis TaxID=1905677 RepID=A0A2N5Y092_9GAMM|nr:hypothetical protein CWI75_13555 [Kineobactrum sediminis]
MIRLSLDLSLIYRWPQRSAVVFPKVRRLLEQLGENIKLAPKRRGYTQVLMSERTRLSRLTIRKIEKGPGC